MPAVYVISGPMAAGKSTVARLLAGRFARGVHLEGDVFRRSIVSGRVETTPVSGEEADAQLRLRYRLAATAVDTYVEAGFTVVVEDVIAGEHLGAFRTAIRSRPCHVFVLTARPETLAQRDLARDHAGYGAWSVEELARVFSERTPRLGVWLDTTALTPEETVDAILATPTPASPVEVVDYDPRWPELFETIAAPVRDALGGGVVVEHVGSTSVPGLAAKPIVDIDVVVPSSDDVPGAIERLRSLGYVYQGDKGLPGRESFLWPPELPPHHLYVVVVGGAPHRDHVAFRDHLRRHPEVAARYAALKRSLAGRYGDDRLGYTDAKTEFVLAVLAAARGAS